MQNITTKVLYSGILSPEEGLVWVFFQIQHYVLENVTSLYIVGSYSFSKATDTCSLPIWSQKPAGGEQGFVLG